MTKEITQQTLIDAQDIPAYLTDMQQKDINVVFIDATFVLPSSEEDIHANFQNDRIENARFFDIEEISDKSSDLPHMLPDAKIFEIGISQLGITNEDHLIIYGQHGMIMGPARAWWMFKGFRHENVHVLNGGLPAWKTQNLPTVSGESALFPATSYKARDFNSETVIGLNDLIKNLNDGHPKQVIDARPRARFNGETAEPRPKMRSGHIPNSINLPCSELVNNDGTLKSKKDLTALFTQSGVQLDDKKPIITTCGSGITACALTLALHHIGHDNASVYDGSWSEWGREDAPTPVA